MLTRDDRTVVDCLDVLAPLRPLGLKHVGFKDVGVPRGVMRALAEAIHDLGAASYLEVVSTTAESGVEAARLARDLGIRNLLGGTEVEAIAAVLKGSGTAYFPFPGKPFGHPTRLAGSADDVERDCRRFAESRCAGCDLLAYRATEAAPLELIAAARRGIGDGTLIVAGGVSTAAHIRAVKAAGADAFTIGTAIFTNAYSPSKKTVLSQLEAVLEDCGRA